jgi:hypothetical protein
MKMTPSFVLARYPVPTAFDAVLFVEREWVEGAATCDFGRVATTAPAPAAPNTKTPGIIHHNLGEYQCLVGFAFGTPVPVSAMFRLAHPELSHSATSVLKLHWALPLTTLRALRFLKI